MALFISAHVCKDPSEWALLMRLSTDRRMKEVWIELTRCDRGTGDFVHRALTRQVRTIQDQSDIQNEALGYLLFFTFRAASDQVSVTKFEEQASLRNLAIQRAKILRDTAKDLEPIGARVANEVAVLRRVASWQEQLAETLRGQDDPLTILNDRGDRTARGIQILLAAHLKETFGDHLHGTAARLASVALGLDRLQSPRVSRSAFSGGKRPRKS